MVLEVWTNATKALQKSCKNSDKAHGSPGDPAGAASFFVVWKLADLSLRTAGRPWEKLSAPGRPRPERREAA